MQTIMKLTICNLHDYCFCFTCCLFRGQLLSLNRLKWMKNWRVEQSTLINLPTGKCKLPNYPLAYCLSDLRKSKLNTIFQNCMKVLQHFWFILEPFGFFIIDHKSFDYFSEPSSWLKKFWVIIFLKDNDQHQLKQISLSFLFYDFFYFLCSMQQNFQVKLKLWRWLMYLCI